jgi:hypothetical protein
MSTVLGDSDIIEDGCDCAALYVQGWSVAPRLREEIALSKLRLRLEALSERNVPLL